MGYLFPNCIVCGRGYGFWDWKSTPSWKWKFCSVKCQRTNSNGKLTSCLNPTNKPKPKSAFNVKRRICNHRDYQCFVCSKSIPKGTVYFRRGKRKKKFVCSEQCYKQKNLKCPPKQKYLRSLSARNKSADFYLDGKWRVLRYEILKERGARCGACGTTPKNGAVMHVDHIKPRYKFPNLQYEKTNLHVLCEACNMGKGAWDETDWR